MTFANIQSLRAIAALLVLCTHALYPLVPMRSHPITPWLDSFGPGGVDLFFVISGFIIYNAAMRASKSIDVISDTWSVVRSFIFKRIIRIFPLYWIVFTVAYMAQPYVELAPDWLEKKTLWPLLLLSGSPNYIVMSAWTLVIEINFYLVAVMVLAFFPKRTFFGFMVWAVAIGVSQFDDQVKSQAWASIIFYEFIFGIIAAQLINSGFVKVGRLAVITGAASFFVGAYVLHSLGGWFGTGPLVRTFCFGLPSAVLLYGLVALEKTQNWVLPRFLQNLGDASYSLYLWHQLVFAVLFFCISYLGITESLPRELYALGFIVIAILVGMLSYRFIEKPILRHGGIYILGEVVHAGKVGKQTSVRGVETLQQG